MENPGKSHDLTRKCDPSLKTWYRQVDGKDSSTTFLYFLHSILIKWGEDFSELYYLSHLLGLRFRWHVYNLAGAIQPFVTLSHVTKKAYGFPILYFKATVFAIVKDFDDITASITEVTFNYNRHLMTLSFIVWPHFIWRVFTPNVLSKTWILSHEKCYLLYYCISWPILLFLFPFDPAEGQYIFGENISVSWEDFLIMMWRNPTTLDIIEYAIKTYQIIFKEHFEIEFIVKKNLSRQCTFLLATTVSLLF